MLLKYFYDERLAHASYLVGCQATGEAIVVDPGRNVEQYLFAADDNEMQIIGVTETHIHADFVSGARELAKRIDAKLYLSDEGDENWKYENLQGYDYQLVVDGDHFMIGNIRFEVLHTPGHTPEHISFLVTDTPNKDSGGDNHPMGIFTGDFVFVGDIGRPDLLEEAAGIMNTAEPGARVMFQSLKRFAALPDYVQVWPAHGAGSACGKALGAIPSSTVGYEKIFNWAFQIEDEDEFVRTLLAGQPEAPVYFAMMKKLNKLGAPILGHLPRPQQLSLHDLEALLETDVKIVDTRENEMYALNHIGGTFNIPFTNSFTNWTGWLLDYEEPFYLIADEGQIEEVMRALVSIGLDNAGGFFDTEVLGQWAHEGKALQRYAISTPDKLADQVLSNAVTIVDVRGQAEYDEGRVPGAHHFLLGRLPQTFQAIPTDKPIVLTCETGGRSAIAASILQAKGIDDVINMMGGYRDWAGAKLPVEKAGA
jgi:hydroxyacylglutathione hydrolase